MEHKTRVVPHLELQELRKACIQFGEWLEQVKRSLREKASDKSRPRSITGPDVEDCRRREASLGQQRKHPDLMRRKILFAAHTTPFRVW